MTPIAASTGCVLLAGVAVALAVFDLPRTAIVAVAVAVVLLTVTLSLTLRRIRR